MRKSVVFFALLSAACTYYYTRCLSRYQQLTRWHRLRTTIRIVLERVLPIARLLVAISKSERKIYAPTLSFIEAVRGVPLPPPPPSSSSSLSSESKKLILYQWPLSYFSGKIRAFLRYQRVDFKQVVATPQILRAVLLPATKSHTVPQLRIGNRIIHDSTSIMEEVVRTVPNTTIVEPVSTRQRIACQILELMGDEWLLVSAFHFRWAYSGNGTLSQKMPMVKNSNEKNLLLEHRSFNCTWCCSLTQSSHSTQTKNTAQALNGDIF